MTTMSQNQPFPIRRAHIIGSSFVITIDPSHVKRLEIDEMTFFVQKPVRQGILLEMRKLSDARTNE